MHGQQNIKKSNPSGDRQTYMHTCIYTYEGYSKINLRLVGKNKRVVIASKRTLSSNKELLFLLYAYPHTFSPCSVGVNTDKTWTLSSPLPPAVSTMRCGAARCLAGERRL